LQLEVANFGVAESPCWYESSSEDGWVFYSTAWKFWILS